MGSLCKNKVQVDIAEVRGSGAGEVAEAAGCGYRKGVCGPPLHAELPSFWKDDSSGSK